MITPKDHSLLAACFLVGGVAAPALLILLDRLLGYLLRPSRARRLARERRDWETDMKSVLLDPSLFPTPPRPLDDQAPRTTLPIAACAPLAIEDDARALRAS